MAGILNMDARAHLRVSSDGVKVTQRDSFEVVGMAEIFEFYSLISETSTICFTT